MTGCLDRGFRSGEGDDGEDSADFRLDGGLRRFSPFSIDIEGEFAA